MVMLSWFAIEKKYMLNFDLKKIPGTYFMKLVLGFAVIESWIVCSEGSAVNQRSSILHNIDPLFQPVGHRLPKSPFDNRVRAAVRSGDWKLITGSPGKSTCHIYWTDLSDLITQ